MSDRRQAVDPRILEALAVAQEHVAALNWRRGGSQEIAASIGRPQIGTRRRLGKSVIIAALAAEWLALNHGGGAA